MSGCMLGFHETIISGNRGGDRELGRPPAFFAVWMGRTSSALRSAETLAGSVRRGSLTAHLVDPSREWLFIGGDFCSGKTSWAVRDEFGCIIQETSSCGR